MQETEVGEVVVYNVKDKDIPIVHRIVRKFGTGYVFQNGRNTPGPWVDFRRVLTTCPGCREHAKLLTKGDNNAADDTELCKFQSGQTFAKIHGI